MTAVTDFETGKHYYAQHPIFFGKNVILTAEKVALDGVAEMKFSPKELGLSMKGSDNSLSLNLDVIKPPIWHCEDGVLNTDVEDPKERTYYWSYTNLAAQGSLVLDDTEFEVEG
jgi:predicted secreted hydrolase